MQAEKQKKQKRKETEKQRKRKRDKQKASTIIHKKKQIGKQTELEVDSREKAKKETIFNIGRRHDTRKMFF